jgi:2-amino-4-hydroxy-6-hydroxymethyldihydropteridine diphosphokinase
MSAIVALGSNLGDSARLLAEAMKRLQDFSSQPVLCSSFWRTSPVDCPPDSAAFINAVASLVPWPEETPESLLQKLLALEREFGRMPKQQLNEARPLDLDLIAFGGEVRTSPELTLPHPRAHSRRFVLQPLSEIAPDLLLPGQAKPVRQLLAELAGKEMVEKLPPP